MRRGTRARWRPEAQWQRRADVVAGDSSEVSLSSCARLGRGGSRRHALRQILAGARRLLQPHLSVTGCGGPHPDDSSSQWQQGCAMHRRSRQSSSISSSNIHVFAAEGADELNLGFMRGWFVSDKEG